MHRCRRDSQPPLKHQPALLLLHVFEQRDPERRSSFFLFPPSFNGRGWRLPYLRWADNEMVSPSWRRGGGAGPECRSAEKGVFGGPPPPRFPLRSGFNISIKRRIKTEGLERRGRGKRGDGGPRRSGAFLIPPCPCQNGCHGNSTRGSARR